MAVKKPGYKNQVLFQKKKYAFQKYHPLYGYQDISLPVFAWKQYRSNFLKGS
jgi:hypothetical protein